MMKKFYAVSEKKSTSQDIRDNIYSLMQKYFKDIPGNIFQNIYIDLVLVFFEIKPSCICFPLGLEEIVYNFVSELISTVSRFGFIQNTEIKNINYIPLVVFNTKYTDMIKTSIKTIEKLNIQQVEKYRSILAKMLGYICISGRNDKYLNYRVLFSFTFNPACQQQRPENITTQHLVCWCDELDGFSLKNLVSKLEAMEIAFSVYGHLERVTKRGSRYSKVIPSINPKVARVPEYNIHLQIDMVQQKI